MASMAQQKKFRLKPRTYDEWKKMGFHVRRGEKSTKRNKEGVCLFFGNQVEKNSIGGRGYNDNHGDEAYDEEDYQMWYDMYGCERDWV